MEGSRFFVPLLLVLLLPIPAMPVSAVVHNLNSHTDYPTITAAIGAASAGDTLVADSGTYAEIVDIDRHLALIGDDTGTGLPVIDPGTPGLNSAVTLSAGPVTLDGFVVKGASTGVHITASGAALRNLSVTENEIGIILEGSDDHHISGSDITFNRYDGILGSAIRDSTIDTTVVENNGDRGIVIMDESRNITIRSCTVRNQTTAYGIKIRDSSDATVSDNTLLRNEHGIYLEIARSASVQRNTISRSTYNGIVLDNTSRADISGNTARNGDAGISLINLSTENAIDSNQLYGNTGHGLRIEASDYNTITANRLWQNGAGISLYGSSYSAFSGNNASGNTGYGVLIEPCSRGNVFDGTIAQGNGIAGISGWGASGSLFTASRLENNGAGLILTEGSDWTTIDNNYADNNTYDGIALNDVSGCSVTGNTARRGTKGISLSNTSFSVFSGNGASDNHDYGIILASRSRFNAFHGNDASRNGIGGINVGSSSHNVFTTSTLDRNGYGVMLDHGTNNTFSSGAVSNSMAHAFDIQSSPQTTISGNDIWNNCPWYEGAVELTASDNGDISANRLWDNYDGGIRLRDGSSHNKVNGNTVTNHTVAGIIIGFADGNNITGNTITRSGFGMKLDSARSNTFTRNIIRYNAGGAWLSNSTGNRIFDNVFGNPVNAQDDGDNIWNTNRTAGTTIAGGAWLGGNSWSTYTGTDTDGDGIGDTHLPFSDNGQIATGGDWLPLTARRGQGVPTAMFFCTPVSGAAPLTVTFTDTSQIVAGTAWNWSFGDGGWANVTTPADPKYTYLNAGVYDVSLTVTNASGSDTLLHARLVNVTPGIGDDDGGDDDEKEGAPNKPDIPVPVPPPVPKPAPSQAPSVAPSLAQPVRPVGHPEVPEVAVPAVSLSYPVGFDGLVYNAEGEDILEINLGYAESAGATVTRYPDRVEVFQHHSPGVLLTFWGDRFDEIGGNLTGRVSRAEIATDPLDATLGIGNVSGTVQAVLPAITTNALLTLAISENVSERTRTQFAGITRKNGLQVTGTGYTFTVARINLTTGPANVTLVIPGSWVDLNGGDGNVRILRIADETERGEMLETTYAGTDAGGMTFRGYSPNGTSIFGLVTAEAAAAKQEEQPDMTYVPISKPAIATNVGIFGWCFEVLVLNPLLIAGVIAVLSAILYFGWWKRRL